MQAEVKDDDAADGAHSAAHIFGVPGGDDEEGIMIGTGSDDDPFVIVISTKQLLLNMVSVRLSAPTVESSDMTYKASYEAFPMAVFGLLDVRHRFVPVIIGLASHETEKTFAMIKRTMKVGLSAPSHPAKHLCALSRVDLHPRAHVCSQHWSEKVALWVMDPDHPIDHAPDEEPTVEISVDATLADAAPAIRSANEAVYPGAKHSACLFHFLQTAKPKLGAKKGAYH